MGILKDYHQQSLRDDYDPIVFYANTGSWSYYSLKVTTSDMQKTLANVEKVWKSYFPGSPFQTFFLDEFYNAQYKADQQFNTILWSFTLLAIVVACLGLLGLSAFTLSKKSKEISIRKVLGASAGQIVSLVTKEYLALILIASVLALPLAYYLMNTWLQSYVFRIEIGWWFLYCPSSPFLSLHLGHWMAECTRSASESCGGFEGGVIWRHGGIGDQETKGIGAFIIG
ncbi:MAG: FtsX-like permease family protein [Saprospiraceae bacterium]|nr:FtsX-like permease family protein [Saprospiraceae bacterium]